MLVIKIFIDLHPPPPPQEFYGFTTLGLSITI